MKLSIGFSPCPNDTFIFDAMIHQKIDTEGLIFEPVLADVEELNKMAYKAQLDISKLSYHAFAYLVDRYALLYSGSALGTNCGPLLIAKKALSPMDIEQGPIAIPGKLTTANFLLELAYPFVSYKKEMLFSEIENAILKEKVIAGLIIHENRFTYREKGLVKLMDLGEYWEKTYQLPIPLGGIAVKRELAPEIQQKINLVLHRSVEFALSNPDSSLAYVKQHAQEMDPEVMYKHIDLYVNDFTLKLGESGKKAVNTLFQVARNKKIIPRFEQDIFISDPVAS